MHSPLPGRMNQQSSRRLSSGSAGCAVAICAVAIMAASTALTGGFIAAHATGGRGSTTQATDTEPVELAALRMLALARQDLSEQRLEPARRALEVLIARYPDSASAAPARRELFALYATDPEIVVAAPKSAALVQADQPPLAPQHIRPASTRTAAAAPETSRPESAGGWRTTVIGFRRLQDEFRNSIGDRIFFAAGSADLGARARTVLATQAAWLSRRPEVEIVIEGHADDAMAGADDTTVAESRARAVRDRLVAEGVEPDRIVLTPKGNTDPVATCQDSDCAAQNRRAVIVVGVRRLDTGAIPIPEQQPPRENTAPPARR